MLARAGFRNDPRLAHATGEDDLAQHVVDLVRAGMVQLVALEIDLGAAKAFGEPFGIVERAGATHVVGPEIVHLVPEALVGLGMLVLRLEFEDQGHQRLRDEAPAEIAETSLFVGAGHEAVEYVVGHLAAPPSGSGKG